MASNTTVLLKKSGVSGNTPSDLAYGEVALNYAEGKLFYKNGVGIKSITNQKTFSTINANNTLVLAGSYTDTLTISPGLNVTFDVDAINKVITINSTGSGGGGSSTLAGLTDVTISSPVDGQSLVYDSLSEKWINKTASASGVGGYFHSTLNYFPAYDYAYSEGNTEHETYVGQLTSSDVDGFGVSLITIFDCMDPVGSLQTNDLGVLT
jgi:hypothetical protein